MGFSGGESDGEDSHTRLGGMKRDARGIANQGNRYAKIAKSPTFAQFVSDSPLEKKGLLSPLKHYLERRKSSC